MPKTLSPLAQYLFSREEARVRAESKEEGREEGRVEEQARIVQKYIQNRRKRYFSELQILEDLMSDFGLDETKGRQYMEAGLTKA